MDFLSSFAARDVAPAAMSAFVFIFNHLLVVGTTHRTASQEQTVHHRWESL